MGHSDPRFEAFFAADYYRLVSGLALVTGDRDVATEAVAEAIARAWEQVQRGREIDELGAWVRIVALNVARGTFRRRVAEGKARAKLESTAVHHVPAAGADGRDVRDLLIALPRRQREVVVLVYFLDLSHAEVAAELGISVGTVKVCLRQARATLGGIVRQLDPEDSALPSEQVAR